MLANATTSLFSQEKKLISHRDQRANIESPTAHFFHLELFPFLQTSQSTEFISSLYCPGLIRAERAMAHNQEPPAGAPPARQHSAVSKRRQRVPSFIVAAIIGLASLARAVDGALPNAETIPYQVGGLGSGTSANPR